MRGIEQSIIKRESSKRCKEDGVADLNEEKWKSFQCVQCMTTAEKVLG